MAEAIVAGIVGKQVVAAADVCMTDISADRLQYVSGKYNVETCMENEAAVAEADVVVLAVKPQVFPSVWPEAAESLKSGALVISIMAGISSERIAGGKPVRVVRVMPNTPALVGEGAAGIAAGSFALEEDMEVAKKLMGSVGTAVVVKEEEIDAVSAVSGSGPAYVFYLLEGMLAAADRMGLEKEVARELALSTVAGAAKLMLETGEDADLLRQKVTSKGGSTAAATHTLDERGVKDAIVAALLAAQARGRALADA